MKNMVFLFLIGVLCLYNSNSFAQTPEKFNYQAVIRDNAGELISEQSVGVKLSILNETSTGTVLYSETHTVSTNAYGQISLKVGDGVVASGVFSDVDWASGDKYLKLEIDATGGDTYTSLGEVQLLSVPYALYAQDVANKDDADADITNEIQDLNLTGNTLTITNNTLATPIDLAPYQGTNTDEQTLDLSGTSLSITGGNTIDVSSLQDGVDDADANPANEIQTLTLDGDTLEITNGNSIIFPYDSSRWAINGDKMYYNTGNVGIGTSDPNSKLEVKATATSGALFQVINANNDTVFAVYPDGVKVFVDAEAKGSVGGFAVSGRSPAKGNVDILRVTIDSTRIYVNDTATVKGTVGGFAVSGRSPSKNTRNDLLFVTGDSTRIYVNDAAKGTVGGFAVSGRNPSKATVSKFLDLTSDNYFIGHQSGINIGIGSLNSTLGYESGLKLTDGSYNSFIGYQSGYNTTSGEGNLFLGYQSGFDNSTGDYNTFVGYLAGSNNTTGLFNTFLGSYSGYLNAEADNNTFIGYNSGYSNSLGENNTFFGTETGYNNTDGTSNVFIGNRSGYNNLTGNKNVFIGDSVGMLGDAGDYNVFLGYQSGYSINGGYSNISLGYQSAYKLTSGYNNVAMGTLAAHNLSTGYDNVMIGDSSGYRVTSAFKNLFIGSMAGRNSLNCQENVFIGWGCGYSNVNYNFNVYIGNRAGYLNNGGNNVFIGRGTGGGLESGSNNVLLGIGAGSGSIGGDNNVCIGAVAAGNGDLGNYNVIIGDFAGSYAEGDSSVFIGHRAGYYEYGSQKLYIDNTSTSNPLLEGDFRDNVLTINGDLHYTGTFGASSDIKLKTNLVQIESGLKLIKGLKGYYFDWNDLAKNDFEYHDRKQVGFIAQELEVLIPELVSTGPNGYKSVDYTKITPILVEAINEQQTKIEYLEKENTDLKIRLEKLEQLILK